MATKTNIEGTFWFYSGVTPYLFFQYDNTEFYINFKTVKYCKPNTTEISFLSGYDYDEEDCKETQTEYSSKLKHLRFLLFELDGKETRLDIGYNCNEYHLEYSGETSHVRISIPKNCINSLKQAMDNIFNKGVKDSDGDFKEVKEEIVTLGENSTLQTKCSVWEYNRTDNHDYPDMDDCKFEVVVLEKGTELTVIPNSSSFLPPK